MLKKILYLFASLLILILVFVFILAIPDIPVGELKTKYANESSKFMNLEGMEVHYRDEGTGIPIVLIHGTAASLHTWDDWTKGLSKENFRVIRMDIPAFGLTGPHPAHDYSINSYTNFLDKFLSALDVDSIYLAGNSLGGNIAWNYAAEYPHKVQKLMLIDASGFPGKLPWIFGLAQTPVLNGIIRYITPRSIIKNNLEQVYFDDEKITDDLIERYHKMTLRDGNRQAFIERAKTNYADYTSKLKTLNTETLIIWGAQDTWVSVSQGKKFESILPNAKLIVLENTGHVPMEESPEESLNEAIKFLKN